MAGSSCEQHRPPGAASRWGSGGAPTETRLLELLQLLCGREEGRLGKGGVRTAQGSMLASSRRLQRADGHTSNLVSHVAQAPKVPEGISAPIPLLIPCPDIAPCKASCRRDRRISWRGGKSGQEWGEALS